MRSLDGIRTRKIACSRYLVAAGWIVVAWGRAPFAFCQDACKVVFDAGDRLTATPHHGYSTRTQAPGGKRNDTEDISVGGVIYVQARGKWRKSPLTVPERQKQEQENRKNVKVFSCRHLRDEAVSGEAAGVYGTHMETEDLKADSLVWISNGRGLVLRQEEDLDSGGVKSHVSARYEYGNVSAPSVSP